MAKSKGFFGLRTGSTKSMTFSVLRGQQITKDRVEGGANPRTYSQMTQRMLFANAVKFYKHAKAGFFKFAFEDKKPLESDYNAFMRHSSNLASAVSSLHYNNPAYPAFGNYVLTDGSLPTPDIYWAEDNNYVWMKMATVDDTNTIGAISDQLVELYPGLQYGDICTIAIVHTSLKSDGTMTNDTPNRWDIRQFVLDTDDERSALTIVGVAQSDEEAIAHIGPVGGGRFAADMAKGCAVVFSRNTPSGLKVSTSAILPNGVAKQFMDAMAPASAVKKAATTWGATAPAILQGALAE